MRTPIHPGEILSDELKHLGMNAGQLADHLKVPANRVSQILNKKQSITADTARRLAKFFGMSAQFWMNLQSIYDLYLDSLDTKKRVEIEAIPTFAEAKAGS